jgi:SsrA-binding protein
MSNILVNRKANFEYEKIEEFDAGVVLKGSEVKSIRNGDVSIIDSFIFIKDGEMWIKNMRVSRYHQSHQSEPHEENRDKKLLLKRKQINKISRSLEDRGITCIPISIFYLFNKRWKTAIFKM